VKLILQEDVEKLGSRGQVVDVSSGYARNFLLPRKLAIEASESNMKQLERIRVSLAKKTATEREAAQKQAELLAGVALRFVRKAGENDQLFGSVTPADIADALAQQGFQIDKRQIQLADPIKVIGEYAVTAKVYQDIAASVKVVVEKEA
jgi:large subunit ribosomal protein L9